MPAYRRKNIQCNEDKNFVMNSAETSFSFIKENHLTLDDECVSTHDDLEIKDNTIGGIKKNAISKGIYVDKGTGDDKGFETETEKLDGVSISAW